MRSLLKLLSVALVLLLSTVSASALDVKMYKDMVTDTIRRVLAGSLQDQDVDALIAQQEKLVKLGVEACKEHAAMSEKDAPIMNLVVENADSMQKMTLEEIEKEWVEGGLLKAKGIDFDALDEMGPAVAVMGMVVNPAKSSIALKNYKNTGDSELLSIVKDDLNETIEHLDFVKEHLKMHHVGEGMDMGMDNKMKMP